MKILRPARSQVFYSNPRIQIIDTQAILSKIGLLEQSFPELGPFHRAKLTLKYRFLHAPAVSQQDLGHTGPAAIVSNVVSGDV